MQHISNRNDGHICQPPDCFEKCSTLLEYEHRQMNETGNSVVGIIKRETANALLRCKSFSINMFDREESIITRLRFRCWDMMGNRP